jgi:hypothetical protein
VLSTHHALRQASLRVIACRIERVAAHPTSNAHVRRRIGRSVFFADR